MLTWEDCVEAQALHARGWAITAIAAPTGHDRKTIRAYLNGGRRPGERKPGRPEGLAGVIGYCRQRLTDDPHLWLTTLFEEVVGLGYTASYPAFTAAVRRHGLRPRCQACAAAKTRDRQVIDHPAGEETGVGLAGVARPAGTLGVRREGAPAAGHAGALQPVARLAGRDRGSAAPGPGAAPGRPRNGRAGAL